ncbi:MAG: c-type cytochrome [Candidatus Melainabacteria bacterium]|nr:c-type cytochrome [Candidatus Melainabacteria bacterium]
MKANLIAITKMVSICIFMAASTFSIAVPHANAAPDGMKIFTANCAACHAGGKNIMDPKKPIIGSKSIASIESFKAFLSKQNGKMPAYPKIVANEEALKALHAYVKTLK